MKRLTKIGLVLTLISFAYIFLLHWWIFPYSNKPPIHYYLTFISGLLLVGGLILMVISGSVLHKEKK